MSKLETPLTIEQQYWICDVIGDWYLGWKGRMTENGAPHRLGYAKEILKQMLCDPDEELTDEERMIRAGIFGDERAFKE